MCVHLTSWPQVSYLSQQDVLHILDLARAHTLLQHGEDGTGEPLRIDAFVASELLLDAGQELLYMARYGALSPVRLSDPSPHSRSRESASGAGLRAAPPPPP